MPLTKSPITQLALISIIITEAERVVGRTKLQKIAYLANVSGWDVFSDFKYHYYGPYSETLSSELAMLVENRWVRERLESTELNNPLYIYSAERSGVNRLNALIARARDQDDRLVGRTRGLIRQLSNFSSDDLEIMATLVFIRRDEAIEDDDELVQRVAELKERFTEDRIRSNLRIFRILRNFNLHI